MLRMCNRIDNPWELREAPTFGTWILLRICLPSCALIPDDFLDGLHCVTVVDCTFMPPTPDV